MDYLITESQFLKLKSIIVEQENEEYPEECLKDEAVVLGDFLGMNVEEEDLGPEMSDTEILKITPENIKPQIEKLLSLVNDKTPEELRSALKGLKSPVNEQQTPYLQRQTTLTIFGAPFNFPTVAVHTFVGLSAIVILSQLLKSLFGGASNYSSKRMRRLASRASGCQGGAARAKLVRIRRRREGWRSFLRKLGLR